MKTRMITKGLLAVIMVAMTAVGSYAQDSYREAVKELLSVNSDHIKSMLSRINQAYFKQSDNVNTDELTERYFNEQILDEWAQMMEPSMKARNLTEKELREVTSLLSTPQGKLYKAHKTEWLMKMPGTLFKALGETMGKDFNPNSLADGLVKVNPDIEEAYKAKFQQILGQVFTNDDLNSTLNTLVNDTTARGILIAKWCSNNLETVLMNTAYDHLTMEDLDYGIWLRSHDAYLKMQSELNRIKSQEDNLEEMITEYTNWMEAQGAQPTSEDERLMNMVKVMGEFMGFGPNFPFDDDYDRDGFFDEIVERDQLTSTIVIKSSQDLIDMYDIEITYKGEDGVNVTDTITTTRWEKEVVNKNFPTQIGIVNSRLFLKPGVMAGKKVCDLVCDYTIYAQEFGYNFKIVEERNVPADKVQSIFDDYDFISYQESKMKSWGVENESFRGTFTVEKQEDFDHPFHFIHNK